MNLYKKNMVVEGSKIFNIKMILYLPWIISFLTSKNKEVSYAIKQLMIIQKSITW